MMKWVPSV